VNLSPNTGANVPQMCPCYTETGLKDRYADATPKPLKPAIGEDFSGFSGVFVMC
jgi:hypothetical protein